MSETFTLNPCQFPGILEVGDSAENSIAKSLDKLATRLERMTTGNRMRVTVAADENRGFAAGEKIERTLRSRPRRKRS